MEDIARDPGTRGGDPLLITCGCSCSLPFLYCLGLLCSFPQVCSSSSSSNLVLNHFPPSVGQPDPRAARVLGLQEKRLDSNPLFQDRTVRPRHCTEFLKQSPTERRSYLSQHCCDCALATRNRKRYSTQGRIARNDRNTNRLRTAPATMMML